jgi:Ran GTPase-activating protein (RanGAP) involved in mRNA processing and transport
MMSRATEAIEEEISRVGVMCELEPLISSTTSKQDDDDEIPDIYNTRLAEVTSMLVHNSTAHLSVIDGSDDPEHYMIAHLDALWAIANTLFVNQSLEVLQIAYARQVFGPHEKLAFYIANAICSHPNLQTLDLSFNGMSTDTAYYLGRMMIRNKSIKHLNLCGNWFGDKAAALLIEACALHGGLESLNLSRCGLGRESARQLAKLLDQSSTLTDLVVDGNDFGGNVGSAIFLRSLSFSNLKSISLSDCKVDDSMAILLSEAILSNSIKSFYLSHNALSDSSGVPIIASLRLAKVERLFIEGNQLGPRSANILAQYLEDPSCTLTVISLNNNCIGTEGAVSIALSLKNNRSVKELYLSANHIGPQFGKAICQTFKSSVGETTESSLSVLHISRNELMDEGILDLLEGFAGFSQLTALDIDSNMFSQETNSKITDFYVSESSHLEWLKFEKEDGEEETRHVELLDQSSAVVEAEKLSLDIRNTTLESGNSTLINSKSPEIIGEATVIGEIA